MTFIGILQIALLFTALFLLIKPVGVYLYRVYETPSPFPLFNRLEGKLLSWCCFKSEDQNWKAYLKSLLIFNIMGIVILFCIQRLQHFLPFNPENFQAVPWALALNTAVSFVTNTNWQAYSGEITMSYFTQMVGLTWQNFVSAGTGMAVFLAFARGLSRHATSSQDILLGNFWVDLLRSVFYVFLPGAFIIALLFISQGVIQNFSPTLEITTLEGGRELISMGPVASQEAIKVLGTNGGGFFGANSAHPFENPTPFTNFLQMLSMILIPGALTYTYGKMIQSQKQGWSIFIAMVILSLIGILAVYYFESQPNPLFHEMPLNQTPGNLEGKEVRFGILGSALFANLTTDTSCGATNCLHDSFTPLGGLVLLLNILIGEIVFGGVGVGLFNMLLFIIISVFMAGLMVGRTPEYLGKKIEGKEVRFAILSIAIYPLLILVGAAISVLSPSALASLHNGGPHGLSEILYAYTSAAHNNGSAFGGLNANTSWYNLSLTFAMFVGRFFPIYLGLSIAGLMVNKKIIQPSAGTFPTQGALFIGLLIGVILIVGALTFFPVLAIGPFIEYIDLWQGKSF
ncbi:potassium-transporting ATPase subunit KdpA [Geitlerinema splendidum]|jgi:K+-transporting ATPase ATPase A chain|nr:potassium-transporting ATPase subunit KdpA [Geitlerinema splendidum]